MCLGGQVIGQFARKIPVVTPSLFQSSEVPIGIETQSHSFLACGNQVAFSLRRNEESTRKFAESGGLFSQLNIIFIVG